MALITWGEKLETGLTVIDNQHKHWVGLINQLDQAMVEGRGLEQLVETLNALLEYTHSHFRTEEVLMERHGYEDLALHRREHRVFTDQVEIYRDRLELGQNILTVQVMQYMREWLVTHVTGTDRGYIGTLKEAGVE